MRTTVCLLMMCLLMSTTLLKADYSAVPVCTAAGEQTQPDIDGDWIVWNDARNGSNNTDIYGYILSEPNEVPICTVSGSYQRYTKVSGTTAVWRDERNSQKDVRAFDLLNRVPLDLPNMPLNDGVEQRYPKISGNYILYEQLTGGVFNLFAYNRSTSTILQVSASSYAQLNSDIDGPLVVWMEDRGTGNQLYYRDISQSNPAVKVSASSYGQWYPAVSGDVIVWVEDRGTATGSDIYGYDLSERQEFIVYSGSGTQNRPAISGTIVVWQDESKGTSNFDIWGIDITAGTPFAIVTTTSHDQNPAISGRRVVWQRGTSGNFDIYTAVIPTPTAIAINTPAGGQQFLAKTEIQMNWYLVEGTAPTAVKVEFSSNNGADWQTLAASAPFSGTYLWDPIADLNSTQCKIRISDTSDPLVSAVSGVFTIFRCNPNLTADLTDDCFVGIDDFAEMAAQWLTCGNPYNQNWCLE